MGKREDGIKSNHNMGKPTENYLNHEASLKDTQKWTPNRREIAMGTLKIFLPMFALVLIITVAILSLSKKKCVWSVILGILLIALNQQFW